MTNISDLSTSPAKPEPFIKQVLEHFAKLGIFIVFLVYGVGFVIWYSFLGQFGISPSFVNQLDFVSAACCYLLFTGAFALPTGMLYYYLKNDVEKASPPFDIWIVFILWSILISQLSGLYFPGERTIYCPAVGLFFLLPIAHSFAWFRLKRINKESPFYAFLSGARWIFVYALILGLIRFFLLESVNNYFLYLTLFLYVLPFSAYPTRYFDVRNDTSVLSCTFKILVISSVVLVHIYTFGISQFGMISKRVGGGKSELALLYPSPAFTADLEKALQLPSKDHFLGPVAILVKTDKEIIFVLPAELTSKPKGLARSIKSDLVESMKYIR